MPWYLVKKTNGGFQTYYAMQKPKATGEIVFECESYPEVHEELIRLELERLDASEN